jgi:Rho termination factor, N-terminal domain
MDLDNKVKETLVNLGDDIDPMDIIEQIHSEHSEFDRIKIAIIVGRHIERINQGKHHDNNKKRKKYEQGRYFKCEKMKYNVEVLDKLVRNGDIQHYRALDKNNFFIDTGIKKKCAVSRIIKLLNCKAQIVSRNFQLQQQEEEQEEEEEKEEQQQPPPPLTFKQELEKKSIRKLIELAQQLGIKNARSGTKQDLVTCIMKNEPGQRFIDY